ncbi:hypothetical protein, partial [Salmonella sp. S146_54837]|uniref:hypothetical protein n=1 Tax=Salmonella sp. S146_54837 TaxID=2665635 RepID=UPI001CA83260
MTNKVVLHFTAGFAMSMIVTPTFSHLDEFWRLAVNWLLLFKALKLSFEVGICDIDAHGEHTIT